jgi:hypothetical protein
MLPATHPFRLLLFYMKMASKPKVACRYAVILLPRHFTTADMR